jgi:hypothetical protein
MLLKGGNDMKTNESNCEKSSITYQPCYKAGKFTLIMISIILIGFLSVALYIFFDATQNTRILIVIIGIIMLSIWFFYCRLSLKNMFLEIVVTSDGIVFENINSKIKKTTIKWEDVSTIEFCQDGWYGRKTCKLYLKTAIVSLFSKQKSEYLVFPVWSVNEKELIQLLPKELFKNHPWYM